MQNKNLSSQKRGTLILIPALAIALAVSGCAKKETPRPVVSNNTNAQQVNSNVNENQDAGAVEDGQSGEQGEVIKEENGWKRYVDKNLGIEFRFQDINDETKVTTSGDWLCLEQISADDSYIYIFNQGMRYLNITERNILIPIASNLFYLFF